MNLLKNEDQLTSNMLSKVSLAKDKQAMQSNIVELSKTVVKLSKEKNFDLTGLTSQVVVVLDYSGSMSPEYKSGNVQRALTKLVPLGLNFDDNGEIEVYRFDSSAKQINTSLTIENYANYVNDYVIYGSMGGTYYAEPLKLIYRDYCGGTAETKQPGFFARLLGERASVDAGRPSETPVYVLFITDGDNSDKRETSEILNKLIQNNVFIQFVGVGDDNFNYLETIDNQMFGVSFVNFDNIKSMSANGVYEQILGEFTDWLSKR